MDAGIGRCYWKVAGKGSMTDGKFRMSRRPQPDPIIRVLRRSICKRLIFRYAIAFYSSGTAATPRTCVFRHKRSTASGSDW
jgi:hypothetical protein